MPPTDDASLGVTIGNPAVVRSGGNYRALIYVNGWNVGQYVANVGPQHTFVVPTGILNPRGVNTLALAVTSAGGAANALESVALTNLGTVRGGVPVQTVAAPGWSAATYGAPTALGSVTVDSVTGTATNPIKGGDTFTVNALVTNHARTTAGALTPSLDLPAGWTASKPTWAAGRAGRRAVSERRPGR